MVCVLTAGIGGVSLAKSAVSRFISPVSLVASAKFPRAVAAASSDRLTMICCCSGVICVLLVCVDTDPGLAGGLVPGTAEVMPTG